MEQEHPLKRWLRLNNKRAKWLAERVGVTPEHLSRIINGKHDISRTAALAVQQITENGVTLADWGME